MALYRVVALPKDIADQVRRTLKTPDYGHPAHAELAEGYGPRRECLRTFHFGEEIGK